MQKLFILFISISAINSLAAQNNRYTYTGSYITSGGCSNGHSDLQVMTADHDIWLGNPGGGPLDDGQNGCKEVNEIINCRSQIAHFEYGLQDSGFYHSQTPTIFSFQCK